MKRIILLFLASAIVFASLSFGVFADTEPLGKSEPHFDLYSFSDIIAEFEREPFDFSEFTFPKECETEMTLLEKRNYILLPAFFKNENLGEEEIFISIPSEPESTEPDLVVGGTAGGYDFSLQEFTGKRKEKVKLPLPNQYYAESDDMVRNVFDGIEVTAYAPGRFPRFDDIIGTDRNCYFEFSFDGNYYILTVNGIENFDVLFENFGILVYPLKDGAIFAGKDIYYQYNGKLLHGWYKIGGDRYYFKKDGKAAIGVVIIGKKCYMFSATAEYIGLFSGTAKIDGKKYRFVNGVAVSSETKP